MRHLRLAAVRNVMLLSLAFVFLPAAGQAQWPGFRGPHGTGVSAEKQLPTTWSAKKNLTWTAKLPGPGASSPVIWGDRVFVTSWSGYADGKGNDIKKLQRHLVCVARKTGTILWQVAVPATQPEVPYGRSLGQHGYTTSTPVTDGQRVYVFFGKTGVLAFDFAGKKLWHTPVGKLANNFGSGSSPILAGDLVIVNASVEGGGLVALQKRTGKEVWRVKLYDDSWTTPLLVNAPDKKQELVLMMPAYLKGFDIKTGKELWKCECFEPDYVSANPVTRDNMVYVMGSGNLGQVCMAVRSGGRGDVTKTHIVWKKKVGASFTSPVLAGEYLYFFSRFAHGLKIKTGEEVYRGRLAGLGREYASPVSTGDKIYFFTREGTGHVLAVKGELKSLAENRLDDDDSFVASPALEGGQIFVRSGRRLYCLGMQK